MDKYEAWATISIVVGMLVMTLGMAFMVPRCQSMQMEACAKMCGVGNARLGAGDSSMCTCIVPGKQP